MKKFLLLLVAVVGLSSFTAYEPLKVEGEKIVLRLANTDESKVKIYVTTLDGAQLYSETTEATFIGKVFNFESAYENTYIVTVYDGGKRYSTRIEIE